MSQRRAWLSLLSLVAMFSFARCHCVGRAIKAVAGSIEDQAGGSEPLAPVDYDFAYENGQFYYNGSLLRHCDYIAEWAKVLGPDRTTPPSSSRAVARWHSLGLACNTEDQRIHTCYFHFRWDSDWGAAPSNERYHTKHVLVDGAAIGPDTKAAQLNRGKRGRRFRAGWSPEIYETRSDDGRNMSYLETVQFNRQMEVVFLKFEGPPCVGGDK